MKKILFLIIISITSLVNADELELDCKTSSWRMNAPYSQAWGKSWVPQNHFHVIKNNNSTFVRYGRNFVQTSNVENNSDRIKIKYKKKMKNQNYTGLNFVFFKTNNKFTISFNLPGGYIDAGSVWGKCDILESNASTQIKSKSSNKNNDDYGNDTDNISWSNIRSSGSSDLYLNNKMNVIKIKSSSKWYDKLHDRYKNNPETDIRIGFYFTNDKSLKPKKYQFEKIKPTSIKAYDENFAKVFEFKTNESKQLLSKDYKYILFLVMDYEQGMYFYTRTTKVKN